LISRGIILTISLKTAQEVQEDLAGRFKRRRIAMNLTQKDLADRSGVTWSSLKRFEREGLIALQSLLQLSVVLDCLGDFDTIAAETPATNSLDAILAKPRVRLRATGRKGRQQ
jgi:transcriptional regulator with XRE-family HTH domain